jgi:bifunctional non-homologous end joining protein LigD
MTPSEFVIVKHEAKRAGLHYDFRFVMPKSDMWASFAVPKGVPLNPGEKVLAIRTPDHSKKDAILSGTLSSGYGAGKFTIKDKGSCEILKYTDRHISIRLRGKMWKGTYHLFETKDTRSKQKQYFLFKGRG